MEGDRREAGTCCSPGRPRSPPELSELPVELRLALTEVAAATREGLLAISLLVGLRVTPS
jgi:hypothetical protein